MTSSSAADQSHNQALSSGSDIPMVSLDQLSYDSAMTYLQEIKFDFKPNFTKASIKFKETEQKVLFNLIYNFHFYQSDIDLTAACFCGQTPCGSTEQCWEFGTRIQDNIQTFTQNFDQYRTPILQTIYHIFASLLASFQQQFPTPKSAENALILLQAFFVEASDQLKYLELLIHALFDLVSLHVASIPAKRELTPYRIIPEKAGTFSQSLITFLMSHAPSSSSSSSSSADGSLDDKKSAEIPTAELKFTSFHEILVHTNFDFEAAIDLLRNSKRKNKQPSPTRIFVDPDLMSVAFIFQNAASLSKQSAIMARSPTRPPSSAFSTPYKQVEALYRESTYAPSQLIHTEFSADSYTNLYAELNILLTAITKISHEQWVIQPDAAVLSMLQGYLTVLQHLNLIMPHLQPQAEEDDALFCSPPRPRLSPVKKLEEKKQRSAVVSPATPQASPQGSPQSINQLATPISAKDRADLHLINAIATQTKKMLGTLVLLPPDKKTLPDAPWTSASSNHLIPGRKLHARITHLLEKFTLIILCHDFYNEYKSNPADSAMSRAQFLVTPPRRGEQLSLKDNIKDHVHDDFLIAVQQAEFLKSPEAVANYFIKHYCEVCCELDAKYEKDKEQDAVNLFTKNIFLKLTLAFKEWETILDRFFSNGSKKQGEFVKPSRISPMPAGSRRGSLVAEGGDKRGRTVSATDRHAGGLFPAESLSPSSPRPVPQRRASVPLLTRTSSFVIPTPGATSES